MTPATLLLLWFTNWAVVSSVAILFVRSTPETAGSSRLDLWNLEGNLPGLVAWLLLAWPVALFRLLPVVLPIRGGGTGSR
ncbi:hypothetical protein ACODT3_43190 [Streptomyces sp. 4.24]|uniref:hypothetical protein n=1 Tax=Streptomyces tritrimontium TaxID=3406573 RepID=UPI003BB6CEF8